MVETKADLAHIVPPITDEMGRNWDQPERRDIEIDDTHALMSLRTFRHLKDYSGTFPSGVYAGKMWKRHDGAFDRNFIESGGKPVWLLCWFGSAVDGACYIHSRELLVVAESLAVEV